MMKIILSPSKTQQNEKGVITGGSPLFYKESKKIRSIVREMSREDIASTMKLKDKKLDEVCGIYAHENHKEVSAIEGYTGMVFKGIRLEEYTQEEIEYLKDHIVILSAMYGVLKPESMIQPYRLDMTMKVPGINLNDFWKNRITDYFGEEDIILNLASKEFSKLVSKEKIDVIFKVQKDGKLKTIGTYAKKARGIMVNEIIKNKVHSPKDIKKFEPMGFKFQDELSNEKEYVFVLCQN